MIELANTKKIEYRELLTPKNYTTVYEKLKSLLPNHYTLFARPEYKAKSVVWYFETDKRIPASKVKSYEKIDEELKDYVSDYIEMVKPEIESVLKHDSYFKQVFEQFFKVPNEKAIKIIETEFDPIVVFTQWACDMLDNNIERNPIGDILKRPKKDRGPVNVKIQYTDGSEAADKPFYFKYRGTKRFKTKQNGQYMLGTLKFGVSFQIFDIVNEQEVYVHDFIVSENGEYIVVFPFFTEVNVKVVNQKNNPIPEAELQITHQNKIWEEKTGTNGNLKLTNIEATKDITVSIKSDLSNAKTITVKRERNEIVLEIIEPFFEDAEIKVLDQFENTLPNRAIFVDYETREKEIIRNEFISDENGQIALSEVLLGSQILCKESDNLLNTQTYKFTQTNGSFIFVITVPVPQTVKFKIVEKKEPVVNQQIKIRYKDADYDLVTDAEGFCEVSVFDLAEGDEFEAEITLPKSRKIKKMFLQKPKSKKKKKKVNENHVEKTDNTTPQNG